MPRKLSDFDAGVIRRRRLAGENVTKLCLEYNVTPSTIYNIERGVTYRAQGDGTTKKVILTGQMEVAELAGKEWKELSDAEFNALPIAERIAYAQQQMARKGK